MSDTRTAERDAAVGTSRGPAMTSVEVKGRLAALELTAAVAVGATLLLVLALAAVQAGDPAVPHERSVPVLDGWAALVLVTLVRLAIQTLEIATHPLLPGGGRSLVRISAVCTAASSVLLVVSVVTLLLVLARNGVVSGVLFLPFQAVVVVLSAVTVVAVVLADLSLRPRTSHRDTSAAASAPPSIDVPADVPADASPSQQLPAPSGEVICCSGGGIRSAAFCLGALTQLAEQGRYGQARTVFGVSGGSWIASAFHNLHRQLPPDRPDLVGEIFALDSPELRRFRRDTRYLSSSLQQRVKMVYAFVAGLLVNLALVLATLRLASWFIGWVLAATDSNVRCLSGCAPGTSPSFGLPPVSGPMGPSPLWVGPLLFVASPVLYVVARILDNTGSFPGQTRVNADRWGAPAPRWSRDWLTAQLISWFDRLTVPVLQLGIFGVVVWPGIPVAVIAFTKAHTAFVDSTVVTWLTAQVSNGQGSGGSGLTVPTLAALATALTAFVGFVRSSIKGPTTGTQTRSGAVVRFVRVSLAPWLGSLLVVVGGYLLVAFWSTTYATQFVQTAGAGDNPSIDATLIFAGFFVLVLPFLTQANFTTLYPFYRDSLAEAYLMGVASKPPGHPGRPEAVALQRSGWPTFSALGRYVTKDAVVRPSLVLCATANVSDRHVVPVGRRATSFLFSCDDIGLPDPHLPDGGIIAPTLYEAYANRRDSSLAAAMAISGAAVAPVAGRESGNVNPYRLLMALANLRLGVWLKNPYWVSGLDLPPQRDDGYQHSLVRRLGDLASTPGPGMILREGLGRTSIYSRYLYITDGGHLDNLGLVEALRSRPAQVIVLDASADEENTFVTLAAAVATARMDLGVEVHGFDVRPSTRRRSKKHVHRGWMTGSATYPDGATCHILYVKALYVRNPPLDLAGYKSRNPQFPLTGTTDQLYDEFDLEAFRELGHFVTGQALTDFPPSQDRGDDVVLDLTDPVDLSASVDPVDAVDPVDPAANRSRLESHDDGHPLQRG